MKVIVAAVGKLKEAYWIDAQDEYVKRLRAYATVSVVEAKDEDALLAAIPARARLYALDERGPTMSSTDFARDVIGACEMHGGGAALAFAIGGPDGHTDRVRTDGHLLSFGKMTIAHRLVRLVLLEQIYRGYKILRGEPYHRE